jgi:arylsulfatase A-like enzyme
VFRRVVCWVLVLGVWLGVGRGGWGQVAGRGGQPDIVIILADDLGFSDLGCYGSEILTPNLDALARGGLRFTQFYSAGRSCPTRAALLTGLYPQQAGVGHMTVDYHRPGYRGDLNDTCVTIAQLLQAAGYRTMICGKWHVTRHMAPDGPKHNWPLRRGFEKFFGTICGGGSYFDPATLTLGESSVPALGEDFYYTDAISNQAVEYIEQAARTGKPLFLYVAYTAPHWPLHAPQAVISRYRGKYACGWDTLRERRHEQMISLGVVEARWPLSPRDPQVGPWQQNEQKAWQQRRMEVYAAQVDEMDRGIGRIIKALRQVGRLDNTLVMFLSDNGASAEEVAASWKGLSIPSKTRTGRAVQVGNNPAVLPGAEDTYQSYGIGWANASNTPFRLYKHWVHEGGIATPLLVHWPAVITTGGKLSHQAGHVIDIMPSCLEVAKTRYPEHFGGYTLTPLSGRSLVPIFRGHTREELPMFWEHEGNRAVRDGKWKLVSRYPGEWELYDMQADRTELNDLAARFPAIVQELSRAYDAWAKRCDVEQWKR